jgi:hypothetical protein
MVSMRAWSPLYLPMSLIILETLSTLKTLPI